MFNVSAEKVAPIEVVTPDLDAKDVNTMETDHSRNLGQAESLEDAHCEEGRTADLCSDLLAHAVEEDLALRKTSSMFVDTAFLIFVDTSGISVVEDGAIVEMRVDDGAHFGGEVEEAKDVRHVGSVRLP